MTIEERQEQSTWLWIAEVYDEIGVKPGWYLMRRFRPSYYPDSIMEELREYAANRTGARGRRLRQYRIRAYRPTQDVHTLSVGPECAHAGA